MEPRLGNGRKIELLPINIILVKTTSLKHDESFSQIIMDGFDFQHCRVALIVLEDLSYDFEMDVTTRQSITSGSLVLTSQPFQGASAESAIHNQLLCVYKYLTRAFTWPR